MVTLKIIAKLKKFTLTDIIPPQTAALISKIVVFKMSLKILNELEKNSKNQELLFDICTMDWEFFIFTPNEWSMPLKVFLSWSKFCVLQVQFFVFFYGIFFSCNISISCIIVIFLIPNVSLEDVPLETSGRINLSHEHENTQCTGIKNEEKFDCYPEDGVNFQSCESRGYKVVLIDTSVGSLIFSDQFLQLSTKLPSDNIYGLGEHIGSLKHSVKWKRFVLFASDQPPYPDKSLYGSHPFYLNMENSGNSHGVLLFNSNAMEVILQPMPALTYRTLGGILDFYITLGPTPNDVISQYTDLIGKPMIPPYWGLGFNLCRYNYGSVERTREIWMRNREFGIPFDVQWNDIDYMSKKRDFTYDLVKYKTLPQFVKEVHEAEMRYVTIIDPAISANQPNGTYPPYDDGVAMDIFVKDINGKILLGKVWPDGPSAFPDFTNIETYKYWGKQIKMFHNKIAIDGAWIDMNEPSNFVVGSIYGCPKDNPLENPPYLPPMDHGTLAGKTLCMSSQQKLSSHYNVHNLYGLTETIATNLALKNLGKRPFIISRSTFVGTGKYGGHWTGDIQSNWYQMKMSIASILNFNMYGVPLVGADICGFAGDTTHDLCQRWMELGAFYPFSRNHNDDRSIDQDPLAFGLDVAKSSKAALTIRYTLLPYLYTLFYENHAFGTPVARPLFFEFRFDQKTYAIDTQFMLGSSLMILPVLEQGAVSVSGYFPKDIWYHYDQNSTIDSEGMTKSIDTPMNKINVYFRGGSVIPTQVPSVTTTQSRLNDFQLIVAFNKNGTAKGSLYLDDGEANDPVEKGLYSTVKFAASTRGWFYSIAVEKGYACKQNMGKVTFLGMQNTAPTQVKANGQPVKFTFDKNKNIMVVTELKSSLMEKLKISLEVGWKFVKIHVFLIVISAT
ncbi:Lysosomal alpha-glucosidase [Nymphon striatum]|nr:Lysosomal alpha-glucosidase [Nymphon striatum]